MYFCTTPMTVDLQKPPIQEDFQGISPFGFSVESDIEDYLEKTLWELITKAVSTGTHLGQMLTASRVGCATWLKTNTDSTHHVFLKCIFDKNRDFTRGSALAQQSLIRMFPQVWRQAFQLIYSMAFRSTIKLLPC
ncbi:hypothetical protein OSTOST_07156, partial [Ostertagia ostertagi]